MGHLQPLVLVAVVFCSPYLEGLGSNSPIDNYIYGLNYDPDQVLAYTGESVDSVPVQTEGKLDDQQNFIVITREKKTAQDGKSDIGVVAANEHRTYPGVLLLANQRLMANSPDVLAVDRAPLTYTVNLPGLTADGSFSIVPNFADYQSKKDKTLNIWFAKYSNSQSVAADFQSDSSFAYSKEYLRVKFGLDFQNTQIESSIDFSAVKNQKKLIMIHKFQQVFYTVSVEPSNKPSDLFGADVTVTELKQKTDSNDPPVIVDSVSYGRTIYVKIETSSTDDQAKGVLSAKLTTFDLSTNDEMDIKNKCKDLNMQVFVVGGSTNSVQLVEAQSFKQVNDLLVANSNFTIDNLGYPISYSAQFIKDNSRAVVQMSTDYIDTTRTIHAKGIISIVHKGWFVMQWSITWSEVSYDNNGTKVDTPNSWEKNCQKITAPFKGDIELPGNSENINVFAREATGLAWDWWRTIINRSGIPLIDKREFDIWGTALSPKFSITPDI